MTEPSDNVSVSRSSWYLIQAKGGSTAVVHADDLAELILSGLVCYALGVTFEEGAEFERLRAAYMSATCRIKAGESDGVG